MAPPPLIGPNPKEYWLPRISEQARSAIAAVDANVKSEKLLLAHFVSLKTDNAKRLWALQMQSVPQLGYGTYLWAYIIRVKQRASEKLALEIAKQLAPLGVVVGPACGSFQSLEHLDAGEALPAAAASEVAKLPFQNHIETFVKADYDISYRPEKGRLSTLLQLTFADKFRLDLDVFTICDSDDPAKAQGMLRTTVGPGQRILPIRFGPLTTPNLHAAKYQKAIAAMEAANLDFENFVSIGLAGIMSNLPIGYFPGGAPGRSGASPRAKPSTGGEPVPAEPVPSQRAPSGQKPAVPDVAPTQRATVPAKAARPSEGATAAANGRMTQPENQGVARSEPSHRTTQSRPTQGKPSVAERTSSGEGTKPGNAAPRETAQKSEPTRANAPANDNASGKHGAAKSSPEKKQTAAANSNRPVESNAGYPTFDGEVLGTVPPDQMPTEPPTSAPYGRQMERPMEAILRSRFPRTRFRFQTSNGESGVDVTVLDGENPGFDIADFKPGTESGWNKFRGQVRRLWSGPAGRPFKAAMISYTADGTIYIETILTVQP